MSPPALLTHHEILAMAEPFVRRGHAVDLAACERGARQRVFKPIARPGADSAAPPLQSSLHLNCSREGRFVLQRRLAHPSGLQATLQLAGARAAALLDALDSVLPESRFERGQGWLLARSYEVLDDAGVQARPLPLFLCRAQVRLALLDLELKLRMPGFRSVAGDIELTPAEGLKLDCPKTCWRCKAGTGRAWCAAPTAGPASCGFAARRCAAVARPRWRCFRRQGIWRACWPSRRYASTIGIGWRAGA